MAIFHLSAQVISRGKGRSVVAAAAYRSGERLKDNYQGLVHDYRKKSAVVFSEIFLPANAPERLRVREILWNEVDEEEKRKDARTARECNVALPVELDREEQEELIRNFARSLTDEGMIADVAIHDKEDGNPHAHILLTTREIQSDGTWGKKNRDWNKKEALEGWRVRWEEMANDALQKAGSEERIDHRSNEARGIEYLPTIHEGYIARQMEKRGEVSERCEANREIRALNEALRIADEKARQIEAEEKKRDEQAEREVQAVNQAAAITKETQDAIKAWKEIEARKAIEEWKKKRREAAAKRKPMLSSIMVDETEQRRLASAEKVKESERRKAEQKKTEARNNQERARKMTPEEERAAKIEREFMDKYKEIVGGNEDSLKKRMDLHKLQRDAEKLLEKEKERWNKELWRRAEEEVQATPEGRNLAREIEELDKRIKEHDKTIEGLKTDREEAYRENRLLKKSKPKDGYFDFLFGNKEKDEWLERIEASKKKCSTFDMLLDQAVRISDDDKKKKKKKKDELAKMGRKVYNKLQANISNPVLKIVLKIVQLIISAIHEILTRKEEYTPLVARSNESPTPGENDSRFMSEMQMDEQRELTR